MTEAEWLTCTDPGGMLMFLHRCGRTGERQLRLFVSHCLRRQVWHLLDERGREAVTMAERLAEGVVPRDEWDPLTAAMDTAFHTTHEKAPKAATKAASMAIWNGVHAARNIQIARHIRDALGQEARDAARRDQAVLLRDLFVFRVPSIKPAWTGWNANAVCHIAQAIYDEKAFDGMPILADALEDGGCDNTDILTHCRSEEPHVRGCWVVDLLLGKS